MIKSTFNVRGIDCSGYFVNKDKAPCILILPGIVGITILEKTLARILVHSGFNAVIANFMPPYRLQSFVRDVNIHDRTYVDSLSHVRDIQNYLKRIPSVDTSKIGIIGMSVGAIFAGLNFKVNPDIRAAVMIAGSGNSAGILARSENLILKTLKSLRKKHFLLKTDEEYEAFMCQYADLDIHKIYRTIDPKKIMMIISMNDSVVPTELQLETWDEFGRPEAYFVKDSHYETVIKSPFLYYRQIYQFLNSCLVL